MTTYDTSRGNFRRRYWELSYRVYSSGPVFLPASPEVTLGKKRYKVKFCHLCDNSGPMKAHLPRQKSSQEQLCDCVAVASAAQNMANILYIYHNSVTAGNGDWVITAYCIIYLPQATCKTTDVHEEASTKYAHSRIPEWIA